MFNRKILLLDLLLDQWLWNLSIIHATPAMSAGDLARELKVVSWS